MSSCPDCSGTGAFSYPCKKCGGKGHYLNYNAFQVACLSCGGTGRFYPKYRKKEGQTIKGLKFPFVIHTLGTGEEILAYRCRTCRGRGEIVDQTAERLRRAAV